KNDYFSDGIAVEILNALAQIPALKVAGRTSAFAFRGKDENPHTIGGVLGVANVLEGSVQTAGDAVRITVQLVDARSGYQLWSENYDRKLTNVFAIEDEISNAVADKLRLRWNEAQPLVAQQAVDPRAHDLYLRGLAEYAARGAALRDAVTHFQQALEIAPHYADAWAALAEANAQLPNYALGDVRTSMSSAESAAQHALAIDPNNAAAHVALGVVYLNRWQWAQADAAYRRAKQLAPGDAEAMHQYAYFLAVTGNLDASLKELDRAIERDPLSPIMNSGRSEFLFFLHRNDEAWVQVQRAIAAHPDFAIAYFFAIPIAGTTGRFSELQAYAQREAELSNESTVVVGQLVRGVADPGKRLAALRVLADTSNHSGLNAYAQVIWYCLLGDRAGAIEVLDAAMRSGMNPAFSAEAVWSPLLDPVRSDPRFVAMLKTMNLPYSPGK
ncbi:MAG TPA: hypothetical protein VL425_11305, partial [Rudaea sp.]|nr:hypothetical protein [Rudaea sp.]